jgi:hypothetical protein
MKALVLARKHRDRVKLKGELERQGYTVAEVAVNTTHLPHGNRFDVVSVAHNEHDYWKRITSQVKFK